MANAYLKCVRTQEYYDQDGWRGTIELDGGGALMNQGIHGVDLIQWMAGEVESVMAYSDHLVRNIEVEDTAVAALRYKNGAFGIIQAATSLYDEEEILFEIHGEKGTISFGDSGFVKFKIQGEEVPVIEGVQAIGGASGPEISSFGHYEVIKDMVEAVLCDHEPMVPGEDAKKAIDIILAIYESSRTGKQIQLN